MHSKSTTTQYLFHCIRIDFDANQKSNLDEMFQITIEFFEIMVNFSVGETILGKLQLKFMSINYVTLRFKHEEIGQPSVKKRLPLRLHNYQ